MVSRYVVEKLVSIWSLSVTASSSKMISEPGDRVSKFVILVVVVSLTAALMGVGGVCRCS